MKIKLDYGTRQIIEVGTQMYRRFNATSWQERIHTGDFHYIIDPARVAALEAQFVGVVTESNAWVN